MTDEVQVPSLTFDPAEVPFSRRGHYLALRQMKDGRQGPGLYLWCVRGGKCDVALIEAQSNGRVEQTTCTATPDMLLMRTANGGVVKIALSLPDRVCLRSEGTGLRLTLAAGPCASLYPVGGGTWIANFWAESTRLRLIPLRGELSVDAPWHEKNNLWQNEHMVMTLTSEDGVAELVIDEHPYSFQSAQDETLDAAAASARHEFGAFAAAFRPDPDPGSAVLAHYILWSCLVAPFGNFQREAMLMNKGKMRHVWSWDHCFNAIAVAGAHPSLAWGQWILFHDHQDVSGRLPDYVNPNSRLWAFVKPPVHGWALREMERRDPGLLRDGDRLRIAEEFLGRLSDWWLRERRWPGDPLPWCEHGNDSADNSTPFDAGVPLVVPEIAAFLAVQLDVVADLCARLGKVDEANRRRAQSAELVDGLLRQLWRDGQFHARLPATGALVTTECFGSCLPALLGNKLPIDVRRAVIERADRFLTPYGFASEWPGSPKYREDGYWRGPVWAPWNQLMLCGLAACGEKARAATAATNFRAVCRTGNFAENFSASTGAPCRSRAYTWTASAFLSAAEFVQSPGDAVTRRTT